MFASSGQSRRAGVGALSALALLLAGCGSSGKSSSAATGGQSSLPGETSQTAPAGAAGGTGGTLHLHADPGGALRFNVKALMAGKPGKVTLVMTNPSQLSHSVAIEGNGVSAAGQVVGPGGTSTVSASLKPGTYTFFCAVPGHREAGMVGTLTVK